MKTNSKTNGLLTKKILPWLGSFLVVAIIAYSYFHVPLMPLIFAGAGTLYLTLSGISVKS